ncbi:MAG: hypothetical protein VR66_00580 [Peptococcaceae bacterium BRH_c23]|nr:MAG: hypothetical protein VR66_00580 [Peptococcaceae bacterium BRH_c23]KJS80762.1 MAG: hypothetical protein JL57_27590 [Desulfosporosinus sp. BICA1-9]HBW35878.1 hypothetical protein [Desulfosporosinus sp.]
MSDRKAQKLQTPQLALLICNAQLHEYLALREIGSSLNSTGLREAIGLESIRHSQISRRLKVLPIRVSEMLYKNVLHQVANLLQYALTHYVNDRQ